MPMSECLAFLLFAMLCFAQLLCTVFVVFLSLVQFLALLYILVANAIIGLSFIKKQHILYFCTLLVHNTTSLFSCNTWRAISDI